MASDDGSADGRRGLAADMVGARSRPTAFNCLLCVALAVASATWVWGLLHLSLVVTLVLWWWPSLLSGVLAGGLFVAALDLTRWLRSLQQMSRAATAVEENDGGDLLSPTQARLP